jgi:hypothetical protein
MRPGVQLAGGRLRACVIAALVWGAIGCATPAMRAPGVTVVPGRVVALPTDGVVWEMDVDGRRTRFKDASEAAVQNFNDSIAYRLGLHGGHSVAPELLKSWPWATPFGAWSARMMSEIMTERLGRAFVQHESVTDWRYGRALAPWRDRLGADYLLVSTFSEGRNTAGRALSVALTGGYLAARRAMACVVRLEDGWVVWCNMIDLVAPLEQRSGAQAVADTLLTGLLGKPPKKSQPSPRAIPGGRAADPLAPQN